MVKRIGAVLALALLALSLAGSVAQANSCSDLDPLMLMPCAAADEF